MKLLVIRTLITLLLATLATTFAAAPPWQVESAGKLSDIMHKGDYSGKIALSTLAKKNQLYALGTMENLQGEVLIIDSHPIIVTAKGSHPKIDSTFTGQAALLVWSQVKAWQTFPITDTVLNMSDLEQRIARLASQAGIDPDSASFPFLIRGKVTQALYHILGSEETAGQFQTHEEMQASGFHGKMQNADIEILGFYSKHTAGIWTHHDSYIHAHIKLKDNSLAGHLDDLTLPPGTTLLLPK